MKAKTVAELLALSANIYALSQDKEFIENLQALAARGAKKAEELIDTISGKEGSGEAMLLKLVSKALQLKQEFEQKMEETAVKVYKKMHIAHSNDLANVLSKIESIEKKMELMEKRLTGLETVQTK
jgi:hypothetical protein